MFRGTIVDLQYFFNLGTRVPFDKDLNMMDPAFRYEQKAAINAQVANPFRNYLTVDKFPGHMIGKARMEKNTAYEKLERFFASTK